MREVLTPNPAWGRHVAWLERPHTHVCQRCGWTYEGRYVESGWPHAGDCCCDDDGLCERCDANQAIDKAVTELKDLGLIEGEEADHGTC